MLSFTINACERQLIEAIGERAVHMQKDMNLPGRLVRKQYEFEMDVTAAHASGNPLDLNRLLAADDFNFAHDVFGIARYLDRDTGGLMDSFRPRYSRKQAA